MSDPTEIKNGCNDLHCPFHGKNNPHGRVFAGKVIRALMHKTVTVEWSSPFLIKKYNRFAYKRSRVKAHAPPCINAKEGDRVVIMECRPISKTKHFVIIQKITKLQKENVRSEANEHTFGTK
ncbi:30S ribosomal protein S17 [archaeon]|nr:30S ribosomal protein S17 [archaeon]